MRKELTIGNVKVTLIDENSTQEEKRKRLEPALIRFFRAIEKEQRGKENERTEGNELIRNHKII